MIVICVAARVTDVVVVNFGVSMSTTSFFVDIDSPDIRAGNTLSFQSSVVARSKETVGQLTSSCPKQTSIEAIHNSPKRGERNLAQSTTKSHQD
jgi:hypothetical protein